MSPATCRFRLWSRATLLCVLTGLTPTARADGLVDAIRAAQGEVTRVTPADLDAARRRLAGSLADLEQFLAPGSRNAQQWKTYLGWPVLRDHAAGADEGLLRGPSLVALQRSVYRLTSGETGLELPQFQHVADDARRVLDLSAVLSGVESQADFHSERLGELAEYLESDPKLLGPRDSFAAEQRLDLLEGVGWSPSVVETLRGRFSRTNLHIVVTESLINRVAERAVHDRRPVRDVILGTRVQGTGDTQGLVRVVTRPSDDAAELYLQFTGATRTSTLGVNGPVCIRSAGATRFSGRKLVELTEGAFSAAPSRFEASTRTRTTGLSKRGGEFGERIVTAIAQKQIEKDRARANAIASRKAERRLESNFNAQVEERIAVARRDFEQQVLMPFARRHARFERLGMSTTADALSVAALHRTRGQLGAPDAPPPAPAGDLSLRVHQTAANNLAAVFLGGATLSQTSPDEPPQLNVPLPGFVERLAARRAPPPADPAAPFQPWSIEFRRRRPVSLAFHEGVVELIVHAERVVAGEDEFDEWDLIASYRPVPADGRWRLEMAGEIDVLPTGFDPRSGGRLRNVDVGLRNNLKSQLNRRSREGRGLPRDVLLRPLALRAGSGEHRGSLSVRRLASLGGWLTAAWSAE